MRLIDADKLINILNDNQAIYDNELKGTYYDGVGDGLEAAIVCVEHAPTIEERKHGHWVGKPIAGYANVRCSVCGMVFRQNTGRWKSCPECTAIMDEVMK